MGDGCNAVTAGEDPVECGRRPAALDVAECGDSGLDAGSRRINIEAAFSCNIPAYMAVMFRHVVLLDDVMTTGATLTECTQVLLRAGVQRVSVWVAARAPEPGSEGGVDSDHDKMA